MLKEIIDGHRSLRYGLRQIRFIIYAIDSHHAKGVFGIVIQISNLDIQSGYRVGFKDTLFITFIKVGSAVVDLIANISLGAVFIIGPTDRYIPFTGLCYGAGGRRWLPRRRVPSLSCCK